MGWVVEESGFDSQQGKEIFSSSQSLDLLWGPLCHLYKNTGCFFLMVKQSEYEKDHSLPSSVEVRNAWSCTPAPPVSLHGAKLY
jgi:hypothetical protein